jgi:hypothetical protein
MARVSVTSGYYASGVTTDHYGSQAESRFIPAIYSKKTLRKFLNDTVFQDICNRDYEGEIKKYGDTAYIRHTPDVIVNDYSIGEDITYDVPKKDAVEMVIDKAKYTAFRVDDVDRAQSDLDLINLFSKNTKKEIAIVVDQEVLAYMATAADSDNMGATAGNISGNVNLGVAGTPVVVTMGAEAVKVILNLNQVLDEQAVDMDSRFVVLPAWFCNLLKDGDLKRADVTGDSTGTIRTGLIGQIDGTKVYRSNHLPVSTTEFSIIAGTNEATTFAAQIDKSDQLKIPTSFGEYWRTLFVWGRLVTQPTALAVAVVEWAAVS